ncbi:hypothetical protein BS78_03G182300, partial [Paspalum vaginatum]
VGGTQPAVSIAQVWQYLVTLLHIDADHFSVHHYSPEDFLVVFRSVADRDRVLHGPPPPFSPFRLIWKRWLWVFQASLEAMRFRVLLVLRGIPAHAWCLDTAQRVLASSCVGIELARDTANKSDLRRFVLAAWCLDPAFIPSGRKLWIPDPKEPHDPGNLFLREHEIIHTKLDGLKYDVSIEIAEVQHWFVRPVRQVSLDARDSDDDNDYPGFHDPDSDDGWEPCPHRTRFSEDVSLPLLGPGWGETFQYNGRSAAWSPAASPSPAMEGTGSTFATSCNGTIRAMRYGSPAALPRPRL